MSKPKKKYAAVIPGLPRLGVDETDPRQQKIDKAKEELKSVSPLEIAGRFVEVRKKRDALDVTWKQLNFELEVYTQLLVASQDRGDEMWGQYGVNDDAVRLATGDTIRLKSEPIGQVVDKEAFRQWCINNGYEKELHLWPSTMQSLAKERVLEGAPIPDGLSIYRKDSLVFTKKSTD